MGIVLTIDLIYIKYLKMSSRCGFCRN